uniref:TNF receptor-associated factor 3-like isoform X1 n=1 Tax=Crassostrea virginica TaxID=6565 RepID=A0A8B8DTK7_CRAVI|nr:TNF receptor-associated factor 3-like isoform X1 [Crassostrea virginica]XP_022330854.1 TNF receptor-associated factor 3-like isoform X1 [Crassostrea virginica]XP_022330855.1 TNF receptor-associated factor 3-like isoform X1 [Crassostrea virginica]
MDHNINRTSQRICHAAQGIFLLTWKLFLTSCVESNEVYQLLEINHCCNKVTERKQYSLASLNPSLSAAEIPQFVNKLQDKYVCPVCNSVLRNAMQLQCGHQICETCIDPLFGENTKASCPVRTDEECEDSFSKNEIYKDMCTRREVMKLPVYCQYSEYGCSETPEWKNLQSHCEKCEYKPVECDKCQEKVPQNQLTVHKESKCSYRDVVCDHCSQDVPFCQMKSHFEHDCPEYPLKCPNGCEDVVLRRIEMESHLQTCPKKSIPCGYRSIGCDFFDIIEKVEKHQVVATDHHLRLAVSFSGQTSDQNKALHLEIEERKTETETLKSTVQELHHENVKLKNEIQPLVNSLTKDTKKKLVTLTERLINLERMVEKQPKREVLEKQEQAISSLKEDLKVCKEQITQLERVGPQGGSTQGGIPQDIKNQLKTNEKQMAIQDIRLAELDLRFQVLETASYDGVLMWKIRDYYRRKQEAKSGRTLSLYSQPFYTSRTGYKMCARVYLNGDGMGKGTHLSLFFVVMRGEYDALLPWPFQQKVSLMLLDQDSFRRHVCDTFQPDTTSTSFKRPTTEMNVATGCPLFISHSVLETKTFLKDDTIFIKVKVDTTNIPVP